MPAEDAEKVMQLVTDTDFFALPPEVRGPSSIADMQQYTVTICQGEERENCHTVEVDYPAKDPQLQELLNVLRTQVKAQRTATPTGTPKAGPDQKP
jgi:hypothetical protein